MVEIMNDLYHKLLVGQVNILFVLYSDRPPEELARFYPQLGDALKQRFAGWRCYIFTADLRLPKLIRLEPARRTPLWNGALECRLYEFDIVSGSHRRPK